MLNENKKLIPNSTQIPHIITDFIIPQLGLAEERCLLYVCRRTYGFHKEEDRISLSQFINGVTDKNGKKLDLGTGISKPAVVQALANLEKAGFIAIRKEVDGNHFMLNLDVKIDEAIKKVRACRLENLEFQKNKPRQSKLMGVVKKLTPPQLSSFTSTGKEALPEVVKKLNTQKKEEEREESNMSQATDFDLKSEIEKMLQDKRQHIKIIGFWIRGKNLKIENKEQLSSVIKRNCRPANLLIGYKPEDIALTIKAIKTTEYIKKYTLETILKYIDDVIATKPAKASECKILKWEMVDQDGTQVMRPVYAN